MLNQSELSSLENFSDISYNEQARIANGDGAKNIFCAGWPAAKTVLEAIAAMVKKPIVKLIIGIVISAGEALKQKVCSQA